MRGPAATRREMMYSYDLLTCPISDMITSLKVYQTLTDLYIIELILSFRIHLMLVNVAPDTLEHKCPVNITSPILILD